MPLSESCTGFYVSVIRFVVVLMRYYFRRQNDPEAMRPSYPQPTNSDGYAVSKAIFYSSTYTTLSHTSTTFTLIIKSLFVWLLYGFHCYCQKTLPYTMYILKLLLYSNTIMLTVTSFMILTVIVKFMVLDVPYAFLCCYTCHILHLYYCIVMKLLSLYL